MLRKVLLLSFVALLLLHCAQVRPPSGGPEDLDPPRIDTTYPPNYSLNFSEDKIRIVFNENVRLNNISEQLIVSPRLENEPEVQVKKGNILNISLAGPLEESSTYTLNFGNSVEDLTEGNKAADLNFVFSTGSYLDSLRVFGTVFNAYTGAPEEDALVMLYTKSDSVDPTTQPPLYFTRVDESGFFKMAYLKNASYELIALHDLNFNYLYDLPNERIAFLDSSILPQQMDSTATVFSLNMFEGRSEEQFIKYFDFGPFGKIQVSLNLPSDSVDFIVDHNRFSKKDMMTELNNARDTLTYWMLDTTNVNSTELYFFDGGLALDTLTIDRAPISKKDLKLNVRPTTVGTLGPRQRLVLEAQRPIFSYNARHIQLLADEDTVHFELVPLDSVKRRFLVDMQRQAASKYQLTLMPGAFEDIYGNGIDSTTFTLGQREADHYGNIKFALNIDTSDTPYILELVSERGKMIERDKLSSGTMKNYINVDPGNYLLRLIFDSNNNDQWDTGDFHEQRLPEKVLYYSEKIVVRSGWDLELEWTIAK